MTETLQLLFQIIQWVGSLFGLIGGIILIMKFFKERPILKIEFHSLHYTNKGKTVFDICLDIDNVGDKPTTIKEIYVEIHFKEEKEAWFMEEFKDFKMFNLNPRSSRKFSEEIKVNKYFEEDIESTVYIGHTHGHEEKKVESVSMHDILSDEDDEHR